MRRNADIDRIPSRPGLPDVVFTANAGLAIRKRFVLSRFLHRERQGEEPYFKEYFSKGGFEIFELPPDLPFEGGGDALLDREGARLLAGYGNYWIIRFELEIAIAGSGPMLRRT